GSSWLWWVALFYWILVILASLLVVKKYFYIRRMSLDLTRTYCRTFNLNMTVFLDRDGVINQDVIKMKRDQNESDTSKYGITSWKGFKFEQQHRRGKPGIQRVMNRLIGSRDVRTAIELFNRVGWKVIVVTNQEVVGRGLVSKKELNDIHVKMLRRLRARLTQRSPSVGRGLEITDILYCPHHPNAECACRKPKSGLFRRAADKYGIKPGDSWMVGDSNKDIAAAKLFGCNSILLTTTHSLEYLRSQKDWVNPNHVSPDLLSAAKWLVRNFDIQAGEERS
ncbi:MAG: D-glycero-alpha-D-manno-heptose-1,7-bisphosphate 7-phosphatase, partial [Candidatus Thorarchaeota archaeon]